MDGEKTLMMVNGAVDRYLSRIGYAGDCRPTADNLAALTKAHRFAVPYETLDLWRRRPTTLATEVLYEKIVGRRRGGYCFELNGLFAWLLRELGYNVREYFGRWLLGEELAVPMRRHRVVCVALPVGPNKIIDVGIGLPFLYSPLDFVFGPVQVRDGRRYRIVRDPTLGAVVELETKNGWTHLFSFGTEAQLPIDFEYAHWWCQTHPDSKFLSGLWVYRPLANGESISISLEEDPERPGEGVKTPVLARFDTHGGVERTVLRDETALADALLANFGIVEESNSKADEKQRRGRRSHASFAKFCVCEASAFH